MLAYLGIAAVAVALGRRHVTDARSVLIAYGALALFTAGCAAVEPWSDSRAVRRVRTLHPLAFVGPLFASAGAQAPALHGRLLDRTMLTWEEHLFGTHPNLLLDSVASRPLNEALSIGYSCYYLCFVLPPAYLILRGLDRALEHYVLCMCLASYLCFLGFIALPLAGPLTSLAGAFSPPHLHGYLAQPLQAWLMKNADPPGTCFPSSHVAGAWAAALALRTSGAPRAATRLMATTAAVVTVAVVYCRYHYALDAAAGAAVAGLAARTAVRLTKPSSVQGAAG
ncbi:phosphatase PAP2 family protein [Streptomyces sp. URMC 127]|uniref:phosphatase PAP2 family protein n=1 Tax=Streptomyces sp. URMC 127 TaxID=3423402 RepID=UPI003F19B854